MTWLDVYRLSPEESAYLDVLVRTFVKRVNAVLRWAAWPEAAWDFTMEARTELTLTTGPPWSATAPGQDASWVEMVVRRPDKAEAVRVRIDEPRVFPPGGWHVVQMRSRNQLIRRLKMALS